MTTYEPTHGSIVHVELYSDDVGATEGFYETSFGWTVELVEDTEEMTYRMWRAPNPPNGGLMPRDERPVDAPTTLLYIDVDDLADAQAAITEAGGELLVEETPVPEMGAFAVFRDPGGVVEAVWEERYEGEVPEGGFPLPTDDPDPGSIVHIELYSDDVGATQAFHESVFGWTFETLGEGAYTMARPPTPPYGGVMEASAEMPAGALAYLLVDDAEETAAAIRDAGGRILREPFVVEGWGTMAVFEAPGGIVQALWESAPAAGRSAADAPGGETVRR